MHMILILFNKFKKMMVVKLIEMLTALQQNNYKEMFLYRNLDKDGHNQRYKHNIKNKIQNQSIIV